MLKKLNKNISARWFIVIRSFFNKNLINKILNEVNEIAKKKVRMLVDFVIEIPK